MRWAAIASLILAIAAPALPAIGQSVPEPVPGVSLFWSSHYQGDTSSFRERIVATGEDWAIYETLWDEDFGVEPGPGDYFALFSGIDYRGCNGDSMPTDAEREGLAALLPFEEQAEFVATSAEGSPTIRVGAAVDFFLMGETFAAREVVFDFDDNDEERTDETLTVLEDYPYTVKLDWDENSIDRVMLIASSDQPIEIPDADMLGTCSVLLN